jgi:hypothetical protein
VELAVGNARRRLEGNPIPELSARVSDWPQQLHGVSWLPELQRENSSIVARPQRRAVRGASGAERNISTTIFFVRNVNARVITTLCCICKDRWQT